jgi:hypothetical protein
VDERGGGCSGLHERVREGLRPRAGAAVAIAYGERQGLVWGLGRVLRLQAAAHVPWLSHIPDIIHYCFLIPAPTPAITMIKQRCTERQGPYVLVSC